MKRRFRSRASLVFIAAGFLALPGCAGHDRGDDGKPAENALRDPSNYSPDMRESDISGGGLGDLDKDALQRDLDNALLR